VACTISLFNVLQAIITDNRKQALTTWTSKLPPPPLSVSRAKNTRERTNSLTRVTVLTPVRYFSKLGWGVWFLFKKHLKKKKLCLIAQCDLEFGFVVVAVLTSKDSEGALETLREQRDAIEELVDDVVHIYHNGFNKAIHNYSQVFFACEALISFYYFCQCESQLHCN
jgi:hypothetical protein